MSAERVERKLSAILAADLAGYSRLMGADEEGTLGSLNGHRRELVDPCIAGHRGRIVKTTGDGLLAEFASVVDAVRCAVEIQSSMAQRNAGLAGDRRFDFRIGINVGDIIERDGDIFGDGVNIAARLEQLSEPGGVCVSQRVHEDVSGKAGLLFDDLGEQRFKNIARPIRAYRLRVAGVGDECCRRRASRPVCRRSRRSRSCPSRTSAATRSRTISAMASLRTSSPHCRNFAGSS